MHTYFTYRAQIFAHSIMEFDNMRRTYYKTTSLQKQNNRIFDPLLPTKMCPRQRTKHIIIIKSRVFIMINFIFMITFENYIVLL